MPKVGNKKFSYSPKGMKAANKYARKTGQSVGGQPSMTNKNMSRRKPGSGGPRDVGASPNRLSNKRPTSIFNKNKGMKLMERRARVKKKLGY